MFLNFLTSKLEELEKELEEAEKKDEEEKKIVAIKSKLFTLKHKRSFRLLGDFKRGSKMIFGGLGRSMAKTGKFLNKMDANLAERQAKLKKLSGEKKKKPKTIEEEMKEVGIE